jgi:hypothetical protein
LPQALKASLDQRKEIRRRFDKASESRTGGACGRIGWRGLRLDRKEDELKEMTATPAAYFSINPKIGTCKYISAMLLGTVLVGSLNSQRVKSD